MSFLLNVAVFRLLQLRLSIMAPQLNYKAFVIPLPRYKWTQIHFSINHMPFKCCSSTSSINLSLLLLLHRRIDKRKRTKNGHIKHIIASSWFTHVSFWKAIYLYRRVYHIVACLQTGVYHIVTYHDRNFIGKWTSGICGVREFHRI